MVPGLWLGRWWLELRRRQLASTMPPCALRDFFLEPFTPFSRDYREVSYLAVDFETTGLNPKRDTILSIGYVRVDGTTIDLRDANHWLIRPDGPLPESSVVIHQISDDRAACGVPLAEALPELLAALAGRVMIAHFARIEREFLDAACRRLYGFPFLVPSVDTLMLEHDHLERHQIPYGQGDLRLAKVRDRYNLPRYNAHSALSDALAGAELFLAIAADRAGDGELPLKRLLG